MAHSLGDKEEDDEEEDDQERHTNYLMEVMSVGFSLPVLIFGCVFVTDLWTTNIFTVPCVLTHSLSHWFTATWYQSMVCLITLGSG